MKKLLFVFNPKSGREHLAADLMEILNIFAQHGYELTVHPTQRRLDAYETICRQASSYDLLVVSGGDGTLNESVRAMMTLPPEKRPPVGYIPSGTMNDFASSHHISKKALSAAADIMRGAALPCDIGGFEDSFFAYVAAFGAFTDVAYDTSQESKNMFGSMAYIFEGMKRLPSLKSYHLTVETADTTVEGDFLFGMVANTTSIGGIRVRAHDISLIDGLSEVILVKASSAPLNLAAIFSAVVAQDFTSDRFVYLKAQDIVLHSPQPIPWTLDGEYGGLHQTVHIHTHQRAIRFLVPPSSVRRPRKHIKKSVTAKGAS